MLRDAISNNFVSFLVIAFFLMSISYNMAYFNSFGDSLNFFLYIPIGLIDLLKTGAISLLYGGLFLIVFRKIFLNPVFSGESPGIITLLILSTLVLVSNVLYFVILDAHSKSTFYLISELAFWSFSLVAFFGILYFFSSEQSEAFLAGTFFASLILIAFFVGWVNAKFDIKKIPYENRSKILLSSDKVISAKVIRSFEKGLLVVIGNRKTDINFISWDQIKEAKFKKVTGL
ncbi:hypothetical protein N9O56_02350 [Rickettsiales bacterium]|nr:hypothetical protein [Rickettsiales bacterium]